MTAKTFLMVLGCLGVLLVAACSQGPQDAGKPIAKVNDYVITEDLFRQSILDRARFHGQNYLTFKDKKRYLDQRIDQELLIQKAMEMGLHKEKEFREAIERFWEQTLISTLMQRKAKELAQQCLVTEDELIELYDKQLKGKPGAPQFKEVRERLARQLQEQKKQRALAQWLDNLQKRASIHIYEANLRAMK